MKPYEISEPVIVNGVKRTFVFADDVKGYKKMEFLNAWGEHLVGYLRGNTIFTFVIYSDRVSMHKTDYFHYAGDFDKRYPVSAKDFMRFCHFM